ncbi:hypothetical protein ACFY4C_41945 [Actinomadura viridis]|uniref:hypothetical protein n=1 Tax=Actinomadura viridis TaxID=58110 RepID=UPI0036932B3F
METKLINLLPHPLVLLGPTGAILLHQEPDGPAARCAEDRREVGALTLPGGATVPLRALGFGEVTNLPAPRVGVLYVVSRPVAETASWRDDLVYPDEVIRDADGHPLGCRALARAA